MGVEYQGISSGKLRRYFSMKNFSDPFRVLKGFKEAKKIMKDYNPSIVFSKGGFVSVPVVLAAKKYKIPVIIHESDMTPGLANRIAMKGASVICHNFPETAASLPDGKAVLTGSPIREELRHGDKAAGLKSLDFTPDKPVIMVMGGSLGAVAVNNAIRGALDELLDKYQIIHLCGKGKLDESLKNIPGYKQFEYVKSELTNYFAAADLLVSRAGANAICEIAALQKPNILIPLSRKASRGDQILNANSFKKQGFSEVIEEEDVTKESLVNMINQVYDNREKYIDAMAKSNNNDAITTILDLIEKNAK